MNKRVGQRRDDGKWEVRAPGANRASAIVSTQAEGIDRARDILANSGGGGAVPGSDCPSTSRPGIVEGLGVGRARR